jgi:tRNA-specific 2-thiouridylase
MSESINIAVAVSGGIDSLFALKTLRGQGMPVFAIYARLLPDAPVLDKLEKICRELDVTFHVIDLQKDFDYQVIRPFIEDWREGKTPNPCARCNAEIKFGKLFEAARSFGATRMATGHYADIRNHRRYGPVLASATDQTKDQSYFLAMAQPDRLKQMIFPLAKTGKNSVIKQMGEQGISVPILKESQEICFVPNRDYRTLLENTGTFPPRPGPALLMDGTVIGQHQGLWRYTQGQRRGLNFSWPCPLYVLRKDTKNNALILGTREELICEGCLAGPVNYHVPPHMWPSEIYAQTRYRQKLVRSEVKHLADELAVTFLEPQGLAVPGQIAVIRDADGCVLAGATITVPI